MHLSSEYCSFVAWAGIIRCSLMLHLCSFVPPNIVPYDSGCTDLFLYLFSHLGVMLNILEYKGELII